MSASKEHQLIAYCLKHNYLLMDKVQELLELKAKGKSIAVLVARELGWDKAKLLDAFSQAQKEMSSQGIDSDIEENLKSQESLDDQNRGATEPGQNKTGQLGKYILVEKLGSGGMGAVYKAYHPDLHSYFAVKTMLSSESGETAIKRFMREAKVSSQLKHPNIVQVYDVGFEGDNHYIVMDYIDGHDLSYVIKEKKLWPRRIFKIILKIAQALSYAHEHGIIHRDIKPGNILIANNSENTPYLTDFGLASFGRENTRLTHSGQILGTPQYMSPEQAQGNIRRIDQRSDIYSLGAVLYEMLTGRPTVTGTTSASVLHKVIYEEPKTPSIQDSNIPKDAEAICLKCLEKDPLRRYQSADGLVQDVDRYLKGYAVQARPSTVFLRFLKWIRRNKAIAITICVSSLIILVGTAGFMFNLKQAEHRAKEGWERAEALLAVSEKHRQELQKALDLAEKRRIEAFDANTQKAQQQKAQSLIDEAVRWAAESRPIDLIEKKLKEAESASPKYATVYRTWGKIYYDYALKYPEKQGEWLALGLEKLDQACRISGDDYLVWFYKYLVFIAMGNHSEASSSLWNIAKLNPENEYGAWGRSALLSIEAKQERDPQKRQIIQQKSLEFYNQSINYNPNFAWAYSGRGVIYAENGRFTEALADYNRAVKLDPYFPEAFNNRANLYTSMKRYQDAMEDFNKTLQLSPKLTLAYYNRGVLYQEIGELNKAAADYSTAVNFDPQCAVAYNARGVLYSQTGLPNKALADFNEVIRIEPNNILAFINRATLYGTQMNRFEDALIDLNKVIKLDPTNYLAYYNRGAIYYTIKRYREAIEDFKTSKRLGNNSQVVDEYIRLAYNALGISQD